MSGRIAEAAIVRAPDAPPEVKEVGWPVLEDGALMVKIDAATICATDLKIWHGHLGSGSIGFPYVPGHETAGTIVEMKGPRQDIKGHPLSEGDRIIWTYPHCGTCYFCAVANQPSLCDTVVRFGRASVEIAPYLLGGCASHQYVPPGSVVLPIPPNVSSELAASAACALRTVVHGFERLGRIAPHEICVIQGSGAVGLYAAAMARFLGAQVVGVLGAPAARLAMARKFGADSVLDITQTTPDARMAWVNDMTEGRGADIVVQCATVEAVPEGLQLVRKGGRYLSIGGISGNPMAAVGIPSICLSVKMISQFGVLSAEPRHYQGALDFLSNAKWPFEEMVSTRYPLSDVAGAFEALASLRDIKPVVTYKGEHSQ